MPITDEIKHRMMVRPINMIFLHQVLAVFCNLMSTQHMPMAAYLQMSRLNGLSGLVGRPGLARGVSQKQRLEKVYWIIRLS